MFNQKTENKNTFRVSKAARAESKAGKTLAKSASQSSLSSDACWAWALAFSSSLFTTSFTFSTSADSNFIF